MQVCGLQACVGMGGASMVESEGSAAKKDKDYSAVDAEKEWDDDTGAEEYAGAESYFHAFDICSSSDCYVECSQT
jgi:hypothetical protein